MHSKKETAPTEQGRGGEREQTIAHGLHPDITAASTFLLWIDPTAAGWCFRTFPDAGTGPGHNFTGTLDQHAAALAADNAAGRGCFAVINAGGHKRADIKRVRAVFADLDGAPLAPVLAGPLLPHIVVESSPGKFHAYYLCNGLAPDQFAGVQRAIAAHFGSDPSVIDLSRLMRLPGYTHAKGEPFTTRVIKWNGHARFTGDQILQAFPPVTAKRTPTSVAAAAATTPATVEPTPELLGDLRSALATLPADNRGDWIAAGAALRCLGDVGKALWIEWSDSSPKHRADTDPDVWTSIGHDSTGPAAIFAKAQAAGWANPRSAAASAARVFADGGALPVASGAFSPCSHLANAYRIVTRYGDRLLWVEGIGWHVWGPPWKADELAARRVVHGLGRIIADDAAAMASWVAAAPDKMTREQREKAMADRFKWAGQSEGEKIIDPSMRMAAALLNCKATDMDANPDLLGLPDGVLDLRSGTVRPHRQTDRITKAAGCHFDPQAVAPTWQRFVAEVMGHDPALINYLQRLAGYALSGRRGDHLLPILYGSGANGKSTFLHALQSVMGDYASTAAPGLLVASSGEQHASATADLPGRRLIVVSETGEFGRLNEEQVKLLTGGDRIKARHLYQRAFDFEPTHLLILQTNHRPRVAGTDEGIWRRLRLIPFTVTIPPERRDSTLLDQLRAELPGILAWAYRGLQAYQRDGLATPEAVRLATADYRGASDQVGAWLADCCAEDRTATASSVELYASYSLWCSINGERGRSQRDLGLRLSERGLERTRSPAGIRWIGIRITGNGLSLISGSSPVISGGVQ